MLIPPEGWIDDPDGDGIICAEPSVDSAGHRWSACATAGEVNEYAVSMVAVDRAIRDAWEAEQE